MAAFSIEFRVEGDKAVQANLERLAKDSPARMRRAINRSVGVARKRVLKSVAIRTGISQRVLGGSKRSGTGYIKQLKARRSLRGGLIALVEGVRFSRLARKTIGRLERKPGGAGKPFSATMRSGHASLFERRPPMRRISAGASPGTRRANLPIREVVIPIQPYAERAIRVHMRRTAREVLPRKVWEELQKSIRSRR